QRDEDVALVRRQRLGDRALERREQLALLGFGVGTELRAREEAPGLRLERDLAALPGPLPQLHRRLEERELVDPRAEAAGAAEVVETGQHAHQRVVGRLERDLVELVAAQVRQAGPAAIHLET